MLKFIARLVADRTLNHKPIGNDNLAFITVDGRVSRNVGYFFVSRCKVTGQFRQRSLVQRVASKLAS